MRAYADAGRYEDARALANLIEQSATASDADRNAASYARGIVAANATPCDRSPQAMKVMFGLWDQAIATNNLAEQQGLFLKAWEACHPNGQALAAAALAAQRRGEEAQARRLFDRALADYEAFASDKVKLVATNGPQGPISALAWSNGATQLRYLAVAHGRYVSLLDADTMRERIQFQHEAEVKDVVFSLDDKVLTVRTDRGSQDWDLANGREYHPPECCERSPPDPECQGCVPRPDPVSRYEVRRQRADLWIWDRRTNRPKVKLTSEYADSSLSVSADGRLAVAVDDTCQVQAYDVSARALVGSVQAVPSVLAVSHDGKQVAIASGDGNLQVWRPERGTDSDNPRVVFQRHTAKALRIQTALRAPVAAGAYEDGRMRVWDLTTGRLLRLIETGHDPKPFLLSEDGRLLAIGDHQKVLVYDVVAGRLLQEFEGLASLGTALPSRESESNTGSREPTLAFSPNGDFLAYQFIDGIDEGVRICPLREESPCVVLLEGTDAVFGPFGPSAQHVASDNGYNEFFTVYDLRSAAPIASRRGRFMGFLPGGHDFLFAATAGTLEFERRRAAAGFASRTAETDMLIGKATLGDTAHAGVDLPIPPIGRRSDATLSGDGKFLVLVDPTSTLISLNTRNWSVVRRVSGASGPLEADVDGMNFFASTEGGGTSLLSFLSGETVADFGRDNWRPRFAHSGRVAVAESADGSIEVWNVRPRQGDLVDVPQRGGLEDSNASLWVTLRAIRYEDSTYAIFPNGEVVTTGTDAGRFLACRAGTESIRFEVCEDMVVRQAWARPPLLAIDWTASRGRSRQATAPLTCDRARRGANTLPRETVPGSARGPIGPAAVTLSLLPGAVSRIPRPIVDVDLLPIGRPEARVVDLASKELGTCVWSGPASEWSGEVTIELIVSPSGEVSVVRAEIPTGDQKDLLACTLRRLQRLKPSAREGRASLRYVLTFRLESGRVSFIR